MIRNTSARVWLIMTRISGFLCLSANFCSRAKDASCLRYSINVPGLRSGDVYLILHEKIALPWKKIRVFDAQKAFSQFFEV